MNIRVALAAAVVALLGIPVAFAASTKTTSSTMPPLVKTAYHAKSSMQSCTMLEAQLDKAVTADSKHPKLTLAKQLQSDGTKLCQSKETKPGAEKLREALYALGASPTA